MIKVNAQASSSDKDELPPGWWMLPKTSTQFKIGGYVKLDMIHDFNPIGSTDFFDVTKIPTDGSEGERTTLHAKETRLYIDTKTPTKVGVIRTYIEGDFYGTSGAFRLRHAFVDIGDKWRAGQWWSNFMDESIIPSTLDFEKPAAYVFARHPMLRYKQALSEDAYLAVALEQPNERAQAPADPGVFESPYPDLTARFRLTKKWGHLQVSGFAAQIRYRQTAGQTQDVGLYGVNLSGQINVLEKDKVICQGVYGPGVGRFRGGLSTGLDANGNLEAIIDSGFTLGYQHAWSPAFSSLLVYNQGSNDNTEGQPGSDIKYTNYFAANLLWHFVENAFAGVEYLHGTREDKSQEDGTANRLQFSVKYKFN
ncbi:MAG: DcaP family trimeric outer membrane transporter [Reichenbachiella sp.]|uniref:DcaP family trimeric outer membrane transporter n=1 Tax=Reichenbachiella sp. TaxID=2184521 RepID=UPI003299CD7A